MKVLGTTVNLSNSFLGPLEEKGYEMRSNQVRIICGCKSRADVNRQCEAIGLRNDTFHPDYTSETFNDEELRLAGNGGIYLQCMTRSGREYVNVLDLK